MPEYQSRTASLGFAVKEQKTHEGEDHDSLCYQGHLCSFSSKPPKHTLELTGEAKPLCVISYFSDCVIAWWIHHSELLCLFNHPPSPFLTFSVQLKHSVCILYERQELATHQASFSTRVELFVKIKNLHCKNRSERHCRIYTVCNWLN